MSQMLHGPPPQELGDSNASRRKRPRRPRYLPRPDPAKDAASPPCGSEVPTLRPDPATGLIPQSPLLRAYDKYQVVYLPQILQQGWHDNDKDPNGHDTSCLSFPDLADLFDSLNDEDRKTWTVENAGANGDGQGSAGREKEHGEEDKPGAFLRRCSDGDATEARRGYCSFLVQNDLERMKETLARLPLEVLPISMQGDADEKLERNDAVTKSTSQPEQSASSTQTMNMRHGPCLWFFFGRNGPETEDHKLASPLEGRPEHTDSVSHDGTWHYQLSGVKEWHLRPTAELLRRIGGDGGDGSLPDNGTVVRCKEGDALLVNTRLWWHRTVIPPQPVPSVSYARDVYFSSRDSTGKEQDDPTYCQPCACDLGMTNVDGLYAADDIEMGTIIFTEHDMPDCELHRSKTNANCELVQLDDGTGAIVSRTDIKAGEFFCIAESSDEEGASGDGGPGVEDDEEEDCGPEVNEDDC